MANYLDLNGTTDVVGRIKAKLNEKASNDDVQLVVDELALKANKEDIKYYTHDVDTIDGGYGIVVNPTTSTKTEAVNWGGGETLTLFEDEQYGHNLPSGTKLYFNLDEKEYLTEGGWYIKNNSNNKRISFYVNSSYKFWIDSTNDWNYVKVYSDGVQINETQKQYDVDTIHFEFVDESLVYYAESFGSRPTIWCMYYTEGDRYSKGVYVDDNNTLAKIATKSEIPNAYSKSETDTKLTNLQDDIYQNVAPLNFSYQTYTKEDAIVLNPNNVASTYTFSPSTLSTFSVGDGVTMKFTFSLSYMQSYKFADANGNYFTFKNGDTITNYTTSGLTMEDLSIITYKSDGTQVTFGDGLDFNKCTYALQKSSSFAITNTDSKTDKTTVNINTVYDNGLYERQGYGKLVKIPTMEDIDEKIGDINNALETIIG
jgi:hypothetical protein